MDKFLGRSSVPQVDRTKLRIATNIEGVTLLSGVLLSWLPCGLFGVGISQASVNRTLSCSLCWLPLTGAKPLTVACYQDHSQTIDQLQTWEIICFL